MTKAKKLRCALYTRKSTEEGLEQDFNSLDAQREAGAAYVRSQASEGWRVIDTAYDDGGQSGGTMERPALQRLLADIALGKVDVVVVYKIDRLTRSLADFARMVEIFDRHGVSFVSVTQAFNTTSSMGRLTLNVLLSFAQFEREVTGERIRDKIAASKARGMWMGGTLPFGFDRPEAGSRALRINATEAAAVRGVFARYLELRSVHALERRLARDGIRSRVRTTRVGRTVGGQPFSRGALFHLLRNRIYLGMIVHKGAVHPGMHPAIIDPETFERVQAMLDANARRKESCEGKLAPARLTGRIFDADGRPMSPTFSYGKTGRCYRYYVSAPLQQGQRRAAEDTAIRRVSAADLEALLTTTLERLLPGATNDPLDIPVRIEVHSRSLHLLLPITRLAAMRDRLGADENAAAEPTDPVLMRLTLAIRMQLRSARRSIERGAKAECRPDPVLINALRSAHAMLARDRAGLPLLEAAPDTPYRRRLVRLAFLAPDLQRAILEGRQPAHLTLGRIRDERLPLSWSEQAKALGFDRAG
ncbi:MAG: recombinase family protein [Alphaproteobacteria bacterium]|nr:recombinase family protein [Alphaproteobacteria bacterium]MDX5370127.1 recombinase family protein [Alphaproteobacteria bacterium]